jgi:hypothetical protein
MDGLPVEARREYLVTRQKNREDAFDYTSIKRMQCKKTAVNHCFSHHLTQQAVAVI